MKIVDDACGRYTLVKTDNLEKRFNLATHPQDIKPNYNVAPGQFMPIITRGEQGNNLEVMRWGFIPHWAKDIKIGYRLINCVSETAFEKPMWKSAVRHYRCLVPSSGFYEWKLDKDNKTKVPYYIHPRDQELYAFAGLWSTWRDVEDREIKSFTIMTTAPNKEMSEVHNRMPVILEPDEESAWLDSSLEDEGVISSLLHSYKDRGLEIFQVSRDVNSPSNNRADLLDPVKV